VQRNLQHVAVAVKTNRIIRVAEHGKAAPNAPVVRRDRDGVQAVERSLSLLERVVAAREEIGLRELGQASGLPVGTTHRLLKALVNQGFVSHNPLTRRYGVGPTALAMAAKIGSSRSLTQLAQPYLQKLVELTGESANLAALDGEGIVYLAHVETARTVRMFTKVGNRVPLHATGTGKAILASMGAEQRRLLLAGHRLRRYTPNTITDRRKLEAELEQIRKRGYAIDAGELEEGVHCVAVPVRDRSAGVTASISVSGPSSRLTLPRIGTLAPNVLRIAEALSKATAD
jgi:IclR family transcriptional regulator, acetate operon repressor